MIKPITADPTEIKKRREANKAVLPYLIDHVPQTFGEAVKMYPKIDCQGHEWDNRTTLENAVYLLKILSK